MSQDSACASENLSWTPPGPQHLDGLPRGTGEHRGAGGQQPHLVPTPERVSWLCFGGPFPRGPAPFPGPSWGSPGAVIYSLGSCLPSACCVQAQSWPWGHLEGSISPRAALCGGDADTHRRVGGHPSTDRLTADLRVQRDSATRTPGPTRLAEGSGCEGVRGQPRARGRCASGPDIAASSRTCGLAAPRWARPPGHLSVGRRSWSESTVGGRSPGQPGQPGQPALEAARGHLAAPS